MKERITKELKDTISILENIDINSIEECSRLLVDCFKSGNKVLLCGNGGSAADCQHIAGEFIGRFMKERDALPAISLSTDTSILTALTNDYSGQIIFSRQVEALGAKGDVLIAISTSGTSQNIIKACEVARDKGMRIIGFTGKNGEKLKGISDACIISDSSHTPRIQEAHITCAHIICGLVEDSLFE